MAAIQLVFPKMPPTSNHIYIKGTILSADARQYKSWFKEHSREYLPQFSEFLGQVETEQSIFALHLRFFMHDLVNKTYGDVSIPPSRRAETRYKKVDLSNRIKLLEDCVKGAFGIDDSRTFAASQEKHQVPEQQTEWVEIYMSTLDPEDFGLPRR